MRKIRKWSAIAFFISGFFAMSGTFLKIMFHGQVDMMIDITMLFGLAAPLSLLVFLGTFAISDRKNSVE